MHLLEQKFHPKPSVSSLQFLLKTLGNCVDIAEHKAGQLRTNGVFAAFHFVAFNHRGFAYDRPCWKTMLLEIDLQSFTRDIFFPAANGFQYPWPQLPPWPGFGAS